MQMFSGIIVFVSGGPVVEGGLEVEGLGVGGLGVWGLAARWYCSYGA